VRADKLPLFRLGIESSLLLLLFLLNGASYEGRDFRGALYAPAKVHDSAWIIAKLRPAIGVVTASPGLPDF
jgi:hypothetical protein